VLSINNDDIPLSELFGMTQGFFGPMGSGKSDEFIRWMKRLRLFAEQKEYVVVVAKSDLDTRLFMPSGTDPSRILQSRSGLHLPDVEPVNSTGNIYYQLMELLGQAERKAERLYGDNKVVFGIPEAHFMGADIIRFAKSLNDNVFFNWDGLDMSFRGEYFLFPETGQTMEDLIDITDIKDHKRAICQVGKCMTPAEYSQRMTDDESRMPEHYSGKLLEVGARQYEARCWKHHKVPGKDFAIFFENAVKSFEEKGMPFDQIETVPKFFNTNYAELELIKQAYLRENQMIIKENNLIHRLYT
jgi:thymidine kinase